LGEAICADELHEHLRQGADLMRRDGIDAEEVSWIERCQRLVLRQEIVRSKTAIAAGLLAGDDVTDACLRLAEQHARSYPLVRLAGAA